MSSQQENCFFVHSASFTLGKLSIVSQFIDNFPFTQENEPIELLFVQIELILFHFPRSLLCSLSASREGRDDECLCSQIVLMANSSYKWSLRRINRNCKPKKENRKVSSVIVNPMKIFTTRTSAAFETEMKLLFPFFSFSFCNLRFIRSGYPYTFIIHEQFECDQILSMFSYLCSFKVESRETLCYFIEIKVHIQQKFQPSIFTTFQLSTVPALFNLLLLFQMLNKLLDVSYHLKQPPAPFLMKVSRLLLLPLALVALSRSTQSNKIKICGMLDIGEESLKRANESLRKFLYIFFTGITTSQMVDRFRFSCSIASLQSKSMKRNIT